MFCSDRDILICVEGIIGSVFVELQDEEKCILRGCARVLEVNKLTLTLSLSQGVAASGGSR